MEKTMRVTGKGQISVKPDTIRLVINLEGKGAEYAQVIKESSDMTNSLKSVFEGLGFDKSDLKTIYFNIDPEFESYQAKDKSWKRRLIGYKYIHKTKIEFPINNELLGKILYSISHFSNGPEFHIEYTVADPEKAKNELLASAVKDGIAKSKVLAEAANVYRGEILSIDYSWEEMDIVSIPMNTRMLETRCMNVSDRAEGSYDIDIEPDDIKVSDSVTIVWKIR